MSEDRSADDMIYNEQLFEAVMCGIVHFSLEERPHVVRFNHACAQIYGYHSKEAFGRDMEDSYEKMAYSYDLEFLRGFIHRAIRSRQTVNFGHRILRKNQTIGYIMGTLQVIVLDDGTEVIQSIFQDSGQHITQADIRKSIYYQSIESNINTKKIILADEDPLARQEVGEKLQEQYTVIEVANAGEVLSVLNKEGEEVSAILLAASILLGQDYRFIAALRGSILYATIPIIALADVDMPIEELLSYGVNEVVYRPYNINIIRMHLMNLIELRDTAVQRNTIEALMNNLSGGVLIARISDEGFIPTYFTDGVSSLSGMTKQETESYINRRKWHETIYEKDLDRLNANVRNSAASGSPIEVTFRVIQKNGMLTWVHMHGTKIRDDEDASIYQCILSPTSSSEKLYVDIMNDSFNAIVVYGEDKDDLLYFNNAAVPLLGEELQEVFNGEELSEDSYIQKQLLLADSRKHITLNGKMIDWNGIKARIIYATDDTDSYRVQMERHQIYEVEMSKQENLSDNVLLSAIFNINRDKLQEFGADSLLGLQLDRTYTTEDCAQSICMYMTDEKLIAELKREFSIQGFMEAYQNGNTKQSMQCKMRREDGGYRWTALSWTLVENPATLELYAFLYIYDIDWEIIRQKSFAKILGFEEEYVACLDLANEKIRLLQLTEDTHVVDRGQIAYEDFRTGFWDESISEKERESLYAQTETNYIIEQLRKEAVYCYYYQTITEDGRRRQKKVRIFYLDEMQDIVCFTRTDVTDFQEEQQRQNEQLAAALTEAEQANKAKSMFLSRMSHDIRTPMNAILGMSNLALEKINHQDTVQDYLEKILASGSYLLGLINDILDMSRIESDRVELDPEPYSIRECVDFVLITLKMQMEAKNLDFSYVELGTMPKHVMLDKMRMQQVFFNLISNAVKFADEGGHVQVIVEPKRYEQGTLWTSIQIKDDGIGIGKEDQEKIFEPFEQGSNQSEARQQGSGLGLAIVKNLIRLMGGTIEVESEKGQGTIFTIHIKLLPVDGGMHVEIDEESVIPQEYDFTGDRVLLVEDNAINMEIARNMLEYKNCQVVGASNGLEAIDILEHSRPGDYQAVFMDMQMPVMGGLEATRQIRSSQRGDLAEIPIIAMTANAFKEDVRKSLEAGMDAHIAKPVDMNILYETLYRVLNRQGAGRDEDGK